MSGGAETAHSADALTRLHHQLHEADARALLVLGRSAHEPDLLAFTGPIHLGAALVLVPRGEAPRLGFYTPMEREAARATGLALITPDELEVGRLAREVPDPVEVTAQILGRALELAALLPGRIALAGRAPAGELVAAARKLEARGVTWLAGDEIALRFRKSKSAAQVAAVRRAAEGTCAAFRRLAEMLAAAADRPAEDGELWLEGERLTVGRLRREVALLFAARGLEQPEGNLLAPAEEGGVPHHAGTDERVLCTGESLVVDLFPRGAMWADCTRTFCVGRPSEPLARAHATVRQALATAWAGLAPGVRGYGLQEEVCRVIGEAGWPTPVSEPDTQVGYVHGLGHGVGFELHEYPSFRKTAGAEGVLETGDVLTLEPGLYQPGPVAGESRGYGLRLEDLIHLGPDGPENLTPLPYDLDPRAWREEEPG